MKSRILVGINNLTANSIGISLVNFLNTIDYSKYDVDLIFVNSQTNLLNQITRKVNIIHSPFSSKKHGFFDKVKMFHRYSLSIMYDLGNKELIDIIKLSSRNNAVYLHHDYKNIYVISAKYNEFVLNNKILDFKYILFPTKQLLESFSNIYADAEDKSFVLPYAINEKRIIELSKAHAELGKPDYKKLIISAGTLNDRSKNYTLMINMMHKLIKLNNHVNLWILGDGPDQVHLKMLVKNLKLEEYVKFLGFKSNPYPYMAMADYIINTSDFSDFSTTMIEAKVLEKPIITTSIDMEGDNAYVVSSNLDKIASEINDILIKNVKYNNNNNFWAENQKVIKTVEKLINK
ncbi:MAG: glycosyltransferase [Bacilli bacterium]|nr:glycosyltransferase [Bacilli bacterium]